MWGPAGAMVSRQWRPEDTRFSPSTTWVEGMELRSSALVSLPLPREPLGLRVLVSGLVFLCCVSNIQGCQRPSPATREGRRKGAGGDEESSEQSSQHILDPRVKTTVVSPVPLGLPRSLRSS